MELSHVWDTFKDNKSPPGHPGGLGNIGFALRVFLLRQFLLRREEVVKKVDKAGEQVDEGQ